MLKLRMKVWTSPEGDRYLVGGAIMKDESSKTMMAYVMSDERTKLVELSPDEWNALPYSVFTETTEPVEERPKRAPEKLRFG